jgi:methionyl-tRNA formyltransferase
VCKITKDSLYVQTGEGMLSLLEVQLEGKKRMEVDAFLRGYSIEEGIVLG